LPGITTEEINGCLHSLRRRGQAGGIFVAPFEQGEIGPDLFSRDLPDGS